MKWRHGALTNRKDEASGAFKIQIIDSPCKYYLHEHQVLSGAWFSTLWFVTKANNFYPAFIYELVLLYWLEHNKKRVLSIFNYPQLL